ncbi:MAG TPA: hypothetical protein DD454_02390 [Candidatus Moranbacteria bacterium]|nr:hypothetical protein [Candidatus Moranbacteria bacterium]
MYKEDEEGIGSPFEPEIRHNLRNNQREVSACERGKAGGTADFKNPSCKYHILWYLRDGFFIYKLTSKKIWKT